MVVQNALYSNLKNFRVMPVNRGKMSVFNSRQLVDQIFIQISNCVNAFRVKCCSFNELCADQVRYRMLRKWSRKSRLHSENLASLDST